MLKIQHWAALGRPLSITGGALAKMSMVPTLDGQIGILVAIPTLILNRFRGDSAWNCDFAIWASQVPTRRGYLGEEHVQRFSGGPKHPPLTIRFDTPEQKTMTIQSGQAKVSQ